MANWSVEETAEGGLVRLSGDWRLLGDAAARRRIARSLEAMSGAREMGWDLRGVQLLDSAGALVLWRAWGKALPKGLRCTSGQRQWFDRFVDLPPARSPEPRGFWRAFAQSGARLAGLAASAGDALLLAGQLIADFAYSVRHPRTIPWREVSAGIFRIGASSLFLLGFVGLLIGVVMTFQLAMSLRRFGANSMIIGLLPLAVLRELSPVITALIVAGRSGSSMAARIGAMQLTEELDALRTFGASPTQRIVLPKIIAMLVSMPLLVLWFDFVAMAGGMVTADLSLDVRYPLFMARLPEALPWVNLWIGLIKGVVFGLIIGIVAGHFGLKVRNSTQSLGNEITAAVVTAITLVILVDAVSGVLLTNVGLFP